MKDGEYGSKELSRTVGGCSMNMGRAANMVLRAQPSGDFSKKVVALGSIGGDEAGEYVE